MAEFSALYDDALHTELGTNDTSVLFTTARRKHALNEGLRQFADLTECWTKRSTITASSATQEYNLNATTVIAAGDYVRVASEGPVFQVSNSNGLELTLAGEDFPQRDVPWLDNAQSGWRSTETWNPSGWYLRSSGGALFFGLDRRFDYSTASTQTAQILLPYVAKPSSMTADTAVPFTDTTALLVRHDLEPYHQALVHFAAHRLELLRKDKQASQEQLQTFLGYVQRYVAATRPKGSRSVRTARSYFRDARRGRYENNGPLAPWWYR